jgi:hypothetical protein
MRTTKRCRHALLVFLIFLIFARESARGAACIDNEEMQADLAKARAAIAQKKKAANRALINAAGGSSEGARSYRR